jgi:hypothetical protein
MDTFVSLGIRASDRMARRSASKHRPLVEYSHPAIYLVRFIVLHRVRYKVSLSCNPVKRTLGIGTGRIDQRNIRVGDLRVWKRKRKPSKAKDKKKTKKKVQRKRKPPIFYVTFLGQSGKRVSRSTGQRLRSSAIPRATIIAEEKQMVLFPAPEPDQQTSLAI